MDAWKNLNSTGYATTDELYTNFGTVKKALENWPAFKVAGFAIYTDASPHAGSALLQDTDYVLEDLDAVKTAEYGEDIYTKLRMINNSTGDIYITYTAIGSYVPADVFQNMLTPYTPATLNISAGNQVTDLSVYERGGASEKWNGWRIKVSWTGGNKTYSHAWTGTTYNFKLPDGSSVAASVFVGYGTGDLTFELDKTNSVWIVLNDQDFILDTWAVTASSVTYTVKRKIKNEQELLIDDRNLITTSSAISPLYVNFGSWTIINYGFIALKKIVYAGTYVDGKYTWGSINDGSTTTTVKAIMLGVSNSQTGYFKIEVIGTWR